MHFKAGLSVVVAGVLSLMAAAPRPCAAEDAVSWVNPLIGTGSGPIGYGGMMPFVTPPFGMTDWTPQTRKNGVPGVSYWYDDKRISGFMGTHQPAIWMGDSGYVVVAAETGALKIGRYERSMSFRHEDEETHPDYYRVRMTDDAGRPVTAEMTATERCGYLRLTFPRVGGARVLVEASRPGIAGFARVDRARGEITGFNPDRMDRNLGPFALKNFKGYFVVQFRQRWTRAATYGMGGHAERGGWAEFDTRDGAPVEVRVGTSFLSVEQARENLRREIPAWDFDGTRAKLHATWEEKLARVQVQSGTDDQKHMLYTAMYHAMLYPRVFSEYGRYYSAFDDKVHEGESYTAYSIWDTFRAENSFLTLLAPERVPGMITALLQNYKEGGWMPKWPNPSYTNIMIGTHADSLVAEAMVKGITGFDRQTAWDAVYKDAMVPPEGDTHERWADRAPHTPYEARGGLTYLKELGYIPVDKTAEAASRTLEDSYDDWCVAQVAKALGKMDEYAFFLKRAQNYRNLFNPATGMMQGRLASGAWANVKDGWTEGNSWVYTYAVMHDEPGLMRLMGGPAKYNALLDEFFAGGHNVHSNEPSHHYGYLYDYSGEAWKTQAKVREILGREYGPGPAGLDGDDDCGQMSAWFWFTAFGFYPVNPASGEYMIGSPLFGEMSLRMGNGKVFRVKAEGNSAENIYIQSAQLNGRALEVPVIRYEDMMAGAELDLVMGPRPSRWGSAMTKGAN